MKFIDLTHTIRHGMPVFPGETPPSLIRDELPEDVSYVTHRLESNMHTGTHIDAPFHYIPKAATVDAYSILNACVGSARVLDATRPPIGAPRRRPDQT